MKMNVRTKYQGPSAGARRLYAENDRSWRRKTTSVSRRNSVSHTPTTSHLQESQSLTCTASNDPSWNVPDFRSGRMYLNPHFLKANSSLESSVAAEDITSESTDISELKYSVHVNPKVLAERVMKLTTQSQPTQADVVADRSAVTNKQGTQLQTWDLHSESSGTDVLTMKYTFPSKTKLVEQTAIVQDTSTSDMARVSGTTSQRVPKKLSSRIKSSQLGSLMSVSRTELVRAKSRGSSQVLQGLENNRPSVSVPSDLAAGHKVVRRPSALSWSRVRRNSVKSSELGVKAAKAVCSKYKLTRSSMARSPVTKSRYSYAANKMTSGEESSRYKIDRRLHKTPKTFTKVKKYSLQHDVPKRGRSNQRIVNPETSNKDKNGQYSFKSLKFGNKTWSNSLLPQKLMVINKKLRKM
jgi:hypothetical protein